MGQGSEVSLEPPEHLVQASGIQSKNSSLQGLSQHLLSLWQVWVPDPSTGWMFPALSPPQPRGGDVCADPIQPQGCPVHQVEGDEEGIPAPGRGASCPGGWGGVGCGRVWGRASPRLWGLSGLQSCLRTGCGGQDWAGWGQGRPPTPGH